MTGPDTETAYRRSRLALAAWIVLAGPVIGALVTFVAFMVVGRSWENESFLNLLPFIFIGHLVYSWQLGLLAAIAAAALWLVADDMLYTTSQRWTGVILIGGMTGAVLPLLVLSVVSGRNQLDALTIMSTALAGIVALALTVRPWSDR
ncbi:hypothetical protein OF122_17870 [Pelagibacterium flavum]|uniref:Uncharacterized protein n=1 Tax=Pelagibacterium flavum TaxID=2984530 RepID=A0ABY6IMR1_9HYPH|nr:hypothetical protein [Pelagibacterium sp. YIM 151497]UYQ71884.1 hypothetical protein OF122_17870 [Pelagibacterium sp. YIM 151497]|tara:strand:- start:375 stop:818 length:444 start_codon:yes stop_codon:yes gene_type:complete